MEKNFIDVKSVSNLMEYGFFIPDYQRGYRWTKQEVEDLLNDIADFSPKTINNSPDKSWYCLQPLVIKESKKSVVQGKNLDLTRQWYEVIDGQQRLTTIFLIGHYINEMWRGKDKDKEIQLSYDTREKSSIFLKSLKLSSSGSVKIEDGNIDFYHISVAYQTIDNWVKNKKNKNFIKDNFIDKFLNSTKVIWYETKEKDTIKIFTRLNMGKIPLTNAELIKALFLNSANFGKDDPEIIKLKQFEIATEWDRIEYVLHNPEIWYFINETENPLPTRIEFIFDLMADKLAGTDSYFTFRQFNLKFQEYTNKEITENWIQIKQYFQTLEEWFLNRELYHKVGFLISCGEKITTLMALSYGIRKSLFRKKLKMEISKKVALDIDELEYGIPTVRRVLLLHNIQSMLNNELETSRFTFDRYKNEKWDVEHIHAVQEKPPKTDKHQHDWLTESLPYIEDEGLKQKIKNFKKKKDFEPLFDEVLQHLSENNHHEEINDISNLTLLDAETNRGYGNAVFPAKRKVIIDKDRKGAFIPLCTKNVFMKFYNENVLQMSLWGEDDRNNYLKDIKSVLKPYLIWNKKTK